MLVPGAFARNIESVKTQDGYEYRAMTDFASDAGRETPAAALIPASALSVTAALIHASVAPAHFGEYWGFGAFFVVIAILQLAWAGSVWRGAGPRVLWIGAAGNLVVALIWLASRTAGLPVGPDVGSAEGVGLHDVLATLDELGISVLVASSRAGDRELPPSVLTSAWTLTAVSFLGAFLGGHGAE